MKGVTYHSKAGIDRWAVEIVFLEMRGGFFVELGALDGVSSSDTLCLEESFGWNGICIEPNPRQFLKLINNRSAACVNCCVDGERGFVDFRLSHGCSGIVDEGLAQNPRTRGDEILQARNMKRVIRLPTVPLDEVLRDQGAPSTIDFLSLDVEGAELRILKAFPFEEFKFNVMVIEKPSQQLNELLKGAGCNYVEKLKINSCFFHNSFLEEGGVRNIIENWREWPFWKRKWE